MNSQKHSQNHPTSNNEGKTTALQKQQHCKWVPMFGCRFLILVKIVSRKDVTKNFDINMLLLDAFTF